LKIETKEKTFQNHYHGEEKNPSNFHQKLLNANFRWGGGGGAFVKALVGTTMANVVVVARFTFV
jgi:hypothetical protein